MVFHDGSNKIQWTDPLLRSPPKTHLENIQKSRPMSHGLDTDGQDALLACVIFAFDVTRGTVWKNHTIVLAYLRDPHTVYFYNPHGIE